MSPEPLCARCGREIEWARNRSGILVALEPSPGGLWVHDGENGYVARVTAATASSPRYASHAKRCETRT